MCVDISVRCATESTKPKLTLILKDKKGGTRKGYHETRFDHPERIGSNRAGTSGAHGGQNVNGPWMLADDGLVAFRRGCGIERLVLSCGLP